MSDHMMLQRGMTADAFDEYLQGQDNVAALAGKLEAGVDGDLLLDTIKSSGKADAPSLKPFFSEVPIGLLGKLALKLHIFVSAEAAAKKNSRRRT